MIGSVLYFFDLVQSLSRCLTTVHFDMFMAQICLIVVEQSMLEKISTLGSEVCNVKLIGCCLRDLIYVKVPLFALYGICECLCNFIRRRYDVGHEFKVERSR